MSDWSNTDPGAPTIQSLARSGTRSGRRLLRGSGWEAGKRIVFLIVLVLIMLIPLGMVQGVVSERAELKRIVEAEVGEQWGPPQTISGPVLVVPYEVTRLVPVEGKESNLVRDTRHAVFTPEGLAITANSTVQRREKSIYEVLVYGADVTIEGRFAAPDFSSFGIAPTDVKWQSAVMVLGISGVRAVRSVALRAGGRERAIDAGVLPSHPFADGVHATIPLEPSAAGFDFSFALALNGRDYLSFQPLGRQSDIAISSAWPHPNFIGMPLPATHDIKDTGFSTAWSISHIATGTPLSWLATDYRLDLQHVTTFGVALTEPGDVHQQADRIVKYGILVIGLTFGTVFVVGLLKRDRVHLVQYLLIGASISLFYLLLLSLAEQMDFALAYLVASLVDIAIVAWYAGTTIRRMLGWLAGGILAAVHGYMFVLLQMESYSLLSGTIGLIAALIAVMVATRKVDWFALGSEPTEQPAEEPNPAY